MRSYPTLWLLLAIAAMVQGQQFEVAVIKPYGAGPRGIYPRENGLFSATGVTLATLVQVAYNLRSYEVQVPPNWTREELFTIEAKAESEGPVTREQHNAMLLDLLNTRFKLRVHREIEERTAYALTVDSTGHKLKLAPPDTRPSENLGRAGPRKSADDVLEEMRFRGYSMRGFADRLQFWIGTYEYASTPVVDLTGLNGIYDVHFPRAREMTRVESDPSIFSVIREAGLRLDKRKVPVEVMRFEADRPELE